MSVTTESPTPPTVATPLVYAAIAAVSKELSKEGIAKDRLNQAQNYKYRGIEDVLNALAPVTSKYALIILPNVISRDVTERATRDGKGTLLHVVVWVEFAFTCVTDGSAYVVKMPGEGLDNSDKGTSKALSMAYKNATLLAFGIPVEGTPDADAGSPEIGTVAAAPKGFDDWVTDLIASASEGLDTLNEAYKKSRKEFKDHLKTSPALLAQLKDAKRQAAEVDKARGRQS